MDWRERFLVAANIELLEAKLGSGQLDKQQAATADALLAKYREQCAGLDQDHAVSDKHSSCVDG